MFGIGYSGTLFVVLILVALLANRDKPLDWLFANIAPGIALMVNLSGALATMNTFPIIALEHNVSFALPIV